MAKPAKLAADVQPHVTRQAYPAGRAIDGVKFVPLRRFVDDGGSFLEIGRLGPEAELLGINLTLRQISYSVLEPGAIKAWHIHRTQSDVVFVPPEGNVLAGLFDVRDSSPTAKTRQRVVLGGGQAQLLLIPPGVAHGFANLGSRRQAMIYLVDVAFDAEDPDEHRLPWDHLGADFWQRQPG